MLLYLLILMIISFLYGGMLLFNDYLSSNPESSFLPPIIMSVSGVMFIVIPIHLEISLKIHILSVLVINVIGSTIYLRMCKK